MLPAYESILEAQYTQVVRPGDVVIDIGAHTGRHALPLARCLQAHGTLIAIEPLPDIYDQLVRNLQNCSRESASWPAVHLHNMAAGEVPGKAQFVYVPEFPEYSGFAVRKYHQDCVKTQTIEVDVQRLDSFTGNVASVRYIKIDAEGGELTILRSGESLIRQFQPLISFEWGDSSLVNYAYTSADCFDYLTSLGYRIYSIFGLPLDRTEFIVASAKQQFWDYWALPTGVSWPFGHTAISMLIEQLNTLELPEATHVAPDAELEQVVNPIAAHETRELELAMAQAQGKQIAQLRLALAVSQKHNQDLLQSLSWRLTSPLRTVGRWLGMH